MRLLAKLLLAATILSSTFYAAARSVGVVSGWDKPPYVIAQGDTGFEIELVKSLLQSSGHTVNMMYVPMGRSVRLVKERIVDVGLSMNARHNVPDSWLSDVYIVYQNVVVTRKDRKLPIQSLDDLTDYTVVGFQTASEALGSEFNKVVSSHKGYLEMADQHRQVSMLLLGSVDAIVLDRNIFNAIHSKHPKGKDTEVVIHELFALSPYRAAIPNAKLRETFNAALADFKQSGQYQLLAQQFDLVNLLDKYAQHPVFPQQDN